MLYGDDHLTTDVTKIDESEVPDHDVLVFGMPCQAFSVAGKRLGFEDMRGTLYFEALRIAREKKPKVLWMENVKGLVGHDKGRTLEVMAQAMCDIGYTIDFEVLNSKYFGVPQNRERIFMIGVRNDLTETSEWSVGKRTDVVAKGKRRIAQLDDIKTFNFDWPSQTEVTVRLRDILEDNVDERFYLSEDKTAKLVAQLDDKDKIPGTIGHHPFSKKFEFNGYNSEISPALIATDYKAPKTILESSTMGGGHREPKIAVKSVGNVNPSGNGMNGQVYDSNGLSPTLTTNKGEGTKITEEVRGIIETDIREIVAKSRPSEEIAVNFKENGDIRPHRLDPRKSGISELNINHEDNTSFTVTSSHAPKIYGETTRYRIRKLTPLECFRLQGFPDEFHAKLTAANVSNSQLYKMAGNAVTVNVIEAIGGRLIPMLNSEVDRTGNGLTDESEAV